MSYSPTVKLKNTRCPKPQAWVIAIVKNDKLRESYYHIISDSFVVFCRSTIPMRNPFKMISLKPDNIIIKQPIDMFLIYSHTHYTYPESFTIWVIIRYYIRIGLWFIMWLTFNFCTLILYVMKKTKVLDDFHYFTVKICKI